MNTQPTLDSVLAKLDRPGSLFAADEVRLVKAALDAQRARADRYQAAYNRLLRGTVRTNNA